MSLYRDVNVVKRKGSQYVHLVPLDVEAEVVHLAHVQRPEDPKTGAAGNVGIVDVLLQGGAIRHDLPNIEALPVLDLHGLGGEGEAVGQQVALAMLCPENTQIECSYLLKLL